MAMFTNHFRKTFEALKLRVCTATTYRDQDDYYVEIRSEHAPSTGGVTARLQSVGESNVLSKRHLPEGPPVHMRTLFFPIFFFFLISHICVYNTF